MLHIVFQLSALFSSTFFFLTLLYPVLGVLEAIAVSIPVSVTVSSWTVLFVSFVLGRLDITSVIITTFVYFGLTYLAYLRLAPRISKIRGALVEEVKKFKWFLGYLVIASLFLGNLAYTHFLAERNGSLYSSGSTWGDLPFHLNIISSLVHGPNANKRFGDFEAIIFAGSNLVYPIIPDYHSALLFLAGSSLPASLFHPTAYLFISYIATFFFFTYRFTNSQVAGILSTMMSVFSGGLGFYLDGTWFWDWYKSRRKLGEFLSYQGYNFVHMRKDGKEAFWFQTLTDMLLPQRSALLAYPMTLTAMALLWIGLNPPKWAPGKDKPKPAPDHRPFVYAGLLAGLLPFTQGHAFIAIGFLGAFLGVMYLPIWNSKQIKEDLLPYVVQWLYFLGPMLGLGFPQLLMFTGKASEWGFAQFTPMWAPGHAWSGSPFNLWFEALGLFIPTALLGYFALDKSQKRFYTAAWVVFLICNYFQFQPWNLDNCKIIQIWHWVACAVCSLVVARGLARPALHDKVVSVLLFLILVGSGFLCVWKELHLNWELFRPQDMQMAKYIRENTKPGSIVLCSDSHNHPVTTLGGRPVLLGYRGWLHSHGYKYYERESDVAHMLRGEGDVPDMLRRHNVEWVAIGDYERNEFKANENFFTQRQDLFEQTFTAASWSIFKVKKFW